MGMFDLSYMDIYALMGADTISLRKELVRTPSLKESLERKEPWTADKLRATGLSGYIYAADLLEGKATICDSAEDITEKALKLGWIRKAQKEEYAGIMKIIPAYLLKDITLLLNKELGIKKR